ncbi:cell wall-associated NlpC family hydrolase [Streptosporangium album]|uniref:Cell wall-associated NlpC family hydrolase n=1 Tax=Streptosporangium album TaxID=47479 RepID=A0A7W7W785_9ACTN|nr:C40 family peptidase [Streptosporangium album]MBB4937032.1 cell wall-associated NlpC family hydrolase [Streptosporangium album]
MSGKIYPRVLPLLVAGAAVLATPSLALADTPTPSPTPTPPAAEAPAPTSPTPAAEVPTLTGPKLKAALAAKAPVPAWKKAVKWAMSKRGTPYVWGGTGNGGFDCSGLMLRAYGAAGIKLPRVTYDQYAEFHKKVAWKDLRPGDLIFFHGLGHVGMISRPGYMVHAPQTGDVVKEEKLTSWRRSSFAGAVRPDRKGVKLSIEQAKLAAAPAPTMLQATS